MIGVRNIRISINNDISINTDYSCDFKINTAARWYNNTKE